MVKVCSKSPGLSKVKLGIVTPLAGQPGTEPLPSSRKDPPLMVKLNAPFFKFQSNELLPVACQRKSPSRKGDAGAPAESESCPDEVARPANVVKFWPRTSTARLVRNRLNAPPLLRRNSRRALFVPRATINFSLVPGTGISSNKPENGIVLVNGP